MTEREKEINTIVRIITSMLAANRLNLCVADRQGKSFLAITDHDTNKHYALQYRLNREQNRQK